MKLLTHIRKHERVAACPKCGSTRPHAALFSLVSTAWRWWGLHTAVTGQVLRCQVGTCDCVFEAHASGTVIERDPLSVPVVPLRQHRQEGSQEPRAPHNGPSLDPEAREMAAYRTERAMRAKGPLIAERPPQ